MEIRQRGVHPVTLHHHESCSATLSTNGSWQVYDGTGGEGRGGDCGCSNSWSSWEQRSMMYQGWGILERGSYDEPGGHHGPDYPSTSPCPYVKGPRANCPALPALISRLSTDLDPLRASSWRWFVIQLDSCYSDYTEQNARRSAGGLLFCPWVRYVILAVCSFTFFWGCGPFSEMDLRLTGTSLVIDSSARSYVEPTCPSWQPASGLNRVVWP